MYMHPTGIWPSLFAHLVCQNTTDQRLSFLQPMNAEESLNLLFSFPALCICHQFQVLADNYIQRVIKQVILRPLKEVKEFDSL